MRALALSSLALFGAGALQTLSLSPFDFWLAAPLSILLVLLVTKALDPNAPLSPKRAAYFGWLIGFGLFASGASWVYVSINTYGHASPLLAGSLTIAFVAALGLFHALMFWLYARLRTKHIAFNACVFSSLWLLNDIFRSFFLTGFPWLFIGDSQLGGPLAGWYPVIGAYGITFIICLSASFIAISLSKRSTTNLLATAIVLLGLWLPASALKGIEWTKHTGEELDVALVQLNIPQQLKWKRSQRPKTMQLLQELSAPHWDKDVIFWPETAVPIFYNEAKRHLRQYDQQGKASTTSVVTGIPYRGWDKELKQAILHNSITAIGNGSGLYHKQKLVPFGEYVPLQDLLRGLIAFFDLPMSNFRKGSETQEKLRIGEHQVAPFICYEVVYPDFVADQAFGSDYLLTISNDSWFGKSIGPLQHLQLAKLRAIENGKYMVRATNNGLTAIINNKGEVTSHAPQFEQAVLEGKVRIFTGATPYTLVGSLPVSLLSIFICVLAFIRNRKP